MIQNGGSNCRMCSGNTLALAHFRIQEPAEFFITFPVHFDPHSGQMSALFRLPCQDCNTVQHTCYRWWSSLPSSDTHYSQQCQDNCFHMKGNTDKFPSIKLIRLVKQHQSPNYQAQASDSILTNSVNFTLCFSQQICSEVTRAPQNQRPAKSLLSKCDDDWSVCVRHSIHGDRKSGNCIASYFLSNKST